MLPSFVFFLARPLARPARLATFLLFAFVMAHSGRHHQPHTEWPSASWMVVAAAAAAADNGAATAELWIHYGPWLSSRGLVAAAVAANATRIDFVVCPPTTVVPGLPAGGEHGGNLTRADALIREWLDPTLTDAGDGEEEEDTSAEGRERRD